MNSPPMRFTGPSDPAAERELFAGGADQPELEPLGSAREPAGTRNRSPIPTRSCRAGNSATAMRFHPAPSA